MTGLGLFAARLIKDATVYVVSDADGSFAAMSMSQYRELPAGQVAQLRPFDTLAGALTYAERVRARKATQS